MEEIFGVSFSVAGTFAVVVMMIVNAVKKNSPEMKDWVKILLAQIFSFAIVFLAGLGVEEFNWIIYLKTSIAVGLLASGIWDGTTQIGRAIGKEIKS